MYHSTSPRTSPSRARNYRDQGARPSEIGSPTSTLVVNPMADGKIRTKRRSEAVRRNSEGHLKTTSRRRLKAVKEEHRFLLSRERPAVVEVVGVGC